MSSTVPSLHWQLVGRQKKVFDGEAPGSAKVQVEFVEQVHISGPPLVEHALSIISKPDSNSAASSLRRGS